MKRLAGLILILIVACTPATPATPTPDGEPPTSPTVEPTPIIFPTSLLNTATVPPTLLPTPEATLALFNPLNPPRPDEVSLDGITSFALLPDNLADGRKAPDFSARLIGGGTFTLTEQRGKYWLILPTAMGCGECMFSLGMLTQAQPPEPAGLNVLVLDIYEPDLPEYWTTYRSYFEGLRAEWSVVNGSSFMVDYEILGLGNFLVVDPNGSLVFKSNSPPRLEYIVHMYTLGERQGVE